MTNWNLRASKKTGRPTTFTERKVGLRRINSMTIAQKLTKSSFRKRPNLALQSWSSGDFKVSTMYISKTISYYFIQVSVHASISRFLPRDGLLSLSCTMRAEVFFCVFFWFWLLSKPSSNEFLKFLFTAEILAVKYRKSRGLFFLSRNPPSKIEMNAIYFPLSSRVIGHEVYL